MSIHLLETIMNHLNIGKEACYYILNLLRSPQNNYEFHSILSYPEAFMMNCVAQSDLISKM